MSKLTVFALAAALVASMATPVAAAPDHATGLERAREMSMKAFDHGKSADAPGHNEDDKVTGRERAAQAIAKGLDRGNGNGNAFGRGHSAAVLQELLDGGSPSELAGEHGAAVSKMVKAFNALRQQAG